MVSLYDITLTIVLIFVALASFPLVQYFHMNQELVAAFRERIRAGQTKEAIWAEAHSLGYTEAQFEATYEAALAPNVGSGAALPGLWECTALVWRKIRTEQHIAWKTLLIVVALFVTLSTIGFSASFLVPVENQRISFVIMMLLVPLCAAVVSMVLSVAMLRALLSKGQSSLFRESIGFALRQIVPAMVLTLYLTIVTQVGYALLIVPGVIASVYLIFSMPILASGQARGFQAMAESTALVQGRFFWVASRVVVAVASIVFVFWGMAVVGTGLYMVLLASSLAALTLFPFVFVAVLAFFVFAFYAGSVVLVVLFEAVTATPLPQSRSTPLSTIARFYQVLVGIVVGILALVVGVLSYIITTALW